MAYQSKKTLAYSPRPELKKSLGQHFLRDDFYANHAVQNAQLTATTNVFEIGCGDGSLTREILKQPCARLWIFEVDPHWATYVRNLFAQDSRITVDLHDILTVDFAPLRALGRWTLVANLPYNITFSILERLVENRDMLDRAVIMIQEEVAQKLVQKNGRGYGYVSCYFSHFFEIQLLEKVPPSAFEPPPKVDSRLVLIVPHKVLRTIINPEQYWIFIQRIFSQPRRTIKNNLAPFAYRLNLLTDETLALRAQQLNPDQLIDLWHTLTA